MGRLQKARASGAPSLYLQLGVVLCIIKEGWEGTCGTWLLHPFTSKRCREDKESGGFLSPRQVSLGLPALLWAPCSGAEAVAGNRCGSGAGQGARLLQDSPLPLQAQEQTGRGSRSEHKSLQNSPCLYWMH